MHSQIIKCNMTEINSQEKDECFIEGSFQQIENKYLQAQLHVDVVVSLYKELPANQLRSITRPQNLIPRTFSANRCMALLPEVLNQSCVETHAKSNTGTNRIKIANKQRLSLEQFFTRKQFKQVYNRLSLFPSESKSFTGKILSVDSVADYNHKMFRQLELQTKVQTQNMEDSVDANFQSGNICKAFISNNNENQYFLTIENDINTHGYNIWFFFRFRNVRKGLRTFHLINMIKKTDNYSKGMQISVFSMKKYKNSNTQWQKCGDKINFGQTNFSRAFHLTERYYYLSFQYEFEEDDDEVYFAMNQPYTYTRMINHISSLQKNKTNPQINIQIKRLGHTLADNVIPAVRIWTKTWEGKQTILITARQHPCQTVSSFVCEGMINHLISDKPQVKTLLEKYQVLIIPMMNPDGVIHGTSRCNLAGFDLNRQWSQFLIKQFTPQTHRIKKYLTQLHKQNPIKYFFDLHGHGKKLNSFFFSCKKGDNPASRLIELAMNQIQPRFNILDCTYGIDRDKQNTVRSQIFQMGVQNCYTLQNSLFGYINREGQIQQYTETDLFHIGQSVWKGIFVLDKPSYIVKEIFGFSKEELLQNSAVVLAKIYEKQKDENKKAILEDNASDSDPDGDILDLNQRLETCSKNMNLKKKITDNIKKQKVRKKKNQLKISTKKQDRKSSSNSQNDVLQMMMTSNNGQNLTDKKQNLQKQLSLSEQKKNMSKLSFTNKRTTVYSKKIKQKRQTLRETKVFSSQNQTPLKKQSKRSHRQILNSTVIRFKNQRLKNQFQNNQNTRQTSCSVIYEYPHEGMIASRRKMSYKMKTQSSVHAHSQKQIPGVFYHENQSKTDLRYSELKEQSLKALLTDTFSILKIKPKLSIKRYAKMSTFQKPKKQQVLMPKNQRIQPLRMERKLMVESQKRVKTFSSAQNHNFSQRTQANSKQADFRRTQFAGIKVKRNLTDFKYKRFESFLYNGSITQKHQNQNSSVFYYFPVL